MSGAASAFVQVGLEAIGGTFVFLFLGTLMWREVSRGHPRSATWVLAPLMAGLALLAPSGLRVAGLATAVLMAAYLGAVYTQRPLLEWVSGAVASMAVLGVVIAGGARACPAGCASGALVSVGGLLFLGALTHGMLLGHWYLNQPRLPMRPLMQATYVLLGAIVAAGAVGLVLRAALTEGSVAAGLVTFSATAYWWTWAGLLAGTLILAVMVRETVKSRSNQSATGLLYIAMVPALGAQFILDLLVAT